MPNLASARLCEARDGEQKLGGLVTTAKTLVRTDAPIRVLLEPGGTEVVVDWEATLNSPELRSPERMEG